MKNRLTTPEQITDAVQNLRPIVTRMRTMVQGVTNDGNRFSGELFAIQLNTETSAPKTIEVGSDGDTNGQLIPITQVVEFSYDYDELMAAASLRQMTEFMLALA
jgi:hypothetical protein